MPTALAPPAKAQVILGGILLEPRGQAKVSPPKILQDTLGPQGTICPMGDHDKTNIHAGQALF